jgi:hypothetical protein
MVITQMVFITYLAPSYSKTCTQQIVFKSNNQPSLVTSQVLGMVLKPGLPRIIFNENQLLILPYIFYLFAFIYFLIENFILFMCL